MVTRSCDPISFYADKVIAKPILSFVLNTSLSILGRYDLSGLNCGLRVCMCVCSWLSSSPKMDGNGKKWREPFKGLVCYFKRLVTLIHGKYLAKPRTTSSSKRKERHNCTVFTQYYVYILLISLYIIINMNLCYVFINTCNYAYSTDAWACATKIYSRWLLWMIVLCYCVQLCF